MRDQKSTTTPCAGAGQQPQCTGWWSDVYCWLGWRQIMLVSSAARLCAKLEGNVWVGAACIVRLGPLPSPRPCLLTLAPCPTPHHPTVRPGQVYETVADAMTTGTIYSCKPEDTVDAGQCPSRARS